MGKPDFENLEVYKLSENLANEIWNIVEKWDYFARDTIGKQIVRSADSIGANIDERPCGCFIRQGTRELPKEMVVTILKIISDL
ncbi:MAG: four helix bundle protein [Xenococcaceae cyanobacterium MO_167.B52]|nr:four helix bundle protein [Xenococcaceae cyanobacterium MO_167.B52]